MTPQRELVAQRRRDIAREAAEPSGLARRIRAARSFRREIRWPGTTIVIGIRVLTRKELAAAQVAALDILRQRGVEETKGALAHAEHLGAELAVQTLWRAIYESASPEAVRLFATAEDLDSEATEDELQVLLDEYEDLRRSVDPRLEELPEDLFQAFVEAVKKKDTSRSSSIVSAMPRRWLLSMVGRLASSPTSSSLNTDSASNPPAAER